MPMNELSLACQQLEAALTACDDSMDSLDYAYAHGYLTAVVISPAPPENTIIFQDLLDNHSLSSDKQCLFSQSVAQEVKAIDRQLNSEDESIDITPDNREALAIWCTGFLELHFQQADTWLKNQEQEVSELILPLMLLSGLFDDEPEFKKMANDEQLLEDMQEQLPEVLTELYLIFRE